MPEDLKRIIFILFLMIYIVLLTHITGCSINDKCHYKDGDVDPISIKMLEIMPKENKEDIINDKN